MSKISSDDDCSVLVIAYDDISRTVLLGNLEPYGVHAVACSSFCEAESYALDNHYRGVLVDLATIIKSKAEEKIVAYTLTRLFPSLRVKTLGSMLIPMTMSGDAKQDKSLNDFIMRTCKEFTPRTLRSGKRKDICVPTYIGSERGFTLNISWSGVFLANMNPEQFEVGTEISVTFPDFDLDVAVIVTRIQRWGQRRPPGIGVKFRYMGEELTNNLNSLLKSSKDQDRDRMTS
jgi:hypothetical protein